MTRPEEEEEERRVLKAFFGSREVESEDVEADGVGEGVEK